MNSRAYGEIRRLGKERERIILELVSRGAPKPASRKPERGDPDVAARAVLVRSNPGIVAVDMCAIFDRRSLPLLAKWQERGFKTWSEAYKDSNYRSKIDTLISKDRRKG